MRLDSIMGIDSDPKLLNASTYISKVQHPAVNSQSELDKLSHEIRTSFYSVTKPAIEILNMCL